jgi:hypothetical protein
LTNDENNNNLWLTTIIACNTLCSPEEQKLEQACTAREDVKYDAPPKMVQIKTADGYVSFSRKFKYLGSQISYNLCNNNNINAQLAAASQNMGALKEVWRYPHLDTYSKYLLF